MPVKACLFVKAILNNLFDRQQRKCFFVGKAKTEFFAWRFDFNERHCNCQNHRVFFQGPTEGIIGVSGFGYFNAAYGLFNTLYALSVAGMPIAVSRMVAQNMQQGRYRDVRKIKRLSTVSFLCTGLLGTLLMFAGAGPYVHFAENPNAFLAVFVMAPAIFFVCVSSSYRGYYEGLRNMYPTAWSQISEALVKLACGLLFSSAAVRLGLEEYERFGRVFGTAVETSSQAQLAVLPYGAAGAILGIVVSTGSGLAVFMDIQ